MVKSMINPDSSGKKTKLTLGFMLIMLLALNSSLIASTYSGGSGTSGEPYQIANKTDLIELSNTSGDWSAYFIQTSDISFNSDQTQVDWDNSGSSGPTAGFSPIGNSTTNFTGSYDGDGYTIKNLYINRSSTDHQAFFGYADDAEFSNITLDNFDVTGENYIGGMIGYANGNTTISDVTIINVDFSGYQYVGGMIGYNNGSTDASNCMVTGNGVASYRRIGGVIGYDKSTVQGTIQNCYFSGTLDASGTNSEIGGFIGGKSGESIIQYCGASGTLDADGRNVGGFVGWIDEGEINNCFTSVDVNNSTSSQGRIGGFAGAVAYYGGRSGTVSYCFAIGDVDVPNSSNTSEYGIGGFVGDYYGSTSPDQQIFNSYACGLVSVPDVNPSYEQYVGGFSGRPKSSYNPGSGNYWNTETTNQSSSAHSGESETGINTTEMQTQSTFSDAGWDFTSNWAMSESFTFYEFPCLQWTKSYSSSPSSNQIADLSNLVWLIADNSRWSGSYTQTANIDAAVTYAWDKDFSGYPGTQATPEGWTHIGNISTKFTGSYDGDGYTIDNLFIDRSSTSYVGLFGYTSGATITAIGVTSVDITSDSHVGGLVGRNGGTVSNSYSVGIVSGDRYVGGLVGYSGSTVSNSYSACDVNGNEHVGGLVGDNSYGTVSNNYSRGNVTRSSGSAANLGGFCGFNYESTIEYCYSTGNVICGGLTDKGFVGDEGATNTYTANFFDSEASNQSSATGATGKTTAEMTNATTTDNIYLDAGWDFKGESDNGTEDIWNIGNGRNSGYPYLDWEYPADPATLPVILSTFTAQYLNNEAQLSWVTQTEEDNVGWNVYRNTEDNLTNAEQINNELIPGNGTTTEPSYYSFADESELTIGQTYYYWLESIDLGGENHIYNTVVNVTIPEPGNDPNLELPTLYEIGTAPNPMQDNTTFKLTMDKTAQVKIEIYNIKGELVKTLPSIIVEADAEQDLYWNGKDSNNGEVGSGLYFYKVKANGKTIENNKLIIMK